MYDSSTVNPESNIRNMTMMVSPKSNSKYGCNCIRYRVDKKLTLAVNFNGNCFCDMFPIYKGWGILGTTHRVISTQQRNEFVSQATACPWIY